MALYIRFTGQIYIYIYTHEQVYTVKNSRARDL